MVRRLHRLDPALFVTWHRCVLDPETGNPVLTDDEGRPVVDPHWYLWRKCDDGKTRLVSMYQHFGHEQAHDLERDLFAAAVRGTASVGEILELVAHSRERMKQREHERFKQNQLDKIAANRHRIHDLIFEGKDGYRDAKPFSAPGVNVRSTPGRIIMDAKEDGWELSSEEA